MSVNSITLVTREAIHIEVPRTLLHLYSNLCSILQSHEGSSSGVTVNIPSTRLHDLRWVLDWTTKFLEIPFFSVSQPLLNNCLHESGVPKPLAVLVEALFCNWEAESLALPAPAWYVAYEFQVGPLRDSPRPNTLEEARLFRIREYQDLRLADLLVCVRLLGFSVLEDLLSAQNAILNFYAIGISADVFARRFGRCEEEVFALLSA